MTHDTRSGEGKRCELCGREGYAKPYRNREGDTCYLCDEDTNTCARVYFGLAPAPIDPAPPSPSPRRSGPMGKRCGGSGRLMPDYPTHGAAPSSCPGCPDCQPQEQEPRRWAIGPGPPGSEGTTELVVRGGPWTEEVEVVEASAYERAEAELERLRVALQGLVDAVTTWDSKTGHGEPWEAQRAADAELRTAARQARSALNPLEEREPHDAACLCGEEGHPYSCDCSACRSYPYHGYDFRS